MANILVVEDDAHMLRILVMWLQRNGHQVKEARNGLDAKKLLSADSRGHDASAAAQGAPAERVAGCQAGCAVAFDLVVSDVNMPGLDGIGLIKWLRDELGSAVPAILLSSRSDQAGLAKTLEAYRVRIHPKPFSPSGLVAEIERRLADATPDHQSKTGAVEDRRLATNATQDGGAGRASSFASTGPAPHSGVSDGATAP